MSTLLITIQSGSQFIIRAVTVIFDIPIILYEHANSHLQTPPLPYYGISVLPPSSSGPLTLSALSHSKPLKVHSRISSMTVISILDVSPINGRGNVVEIFTS